MDCNVASTLGQNLATIAFSNFSSNFPLLILLKKPTFEGRNVTSHVLHLYSHPSMF